MSHLLILLISFLVIYFIRFYIRIHNKIMLEIEERKDEEDKQKNVDYYAKLLVEIRGAFDSCREDDAIDKIIPKEYLFKENVLKHLVLRGFYSRASLKYIITCYDILEKEGRGNLSDNTWIEPWAQIIMMNIYDELNVLTYCLFRYKLGRILLVILFHLNAFSLNSTKTYWFYKENYNTSLYFKNIPAMLENTAEYIAKEMPTSLTFINFYSFKNTDFGWYREDYI